MIGLEWFANSPCSKWIGICWWDWVPKRRDNIGDIGTEVIRSCSTTDIHTVDDLKEHETEWQDLVCNSEV